MIIFNRYKIRRILTPQVCRFRCELDLAQVFYRPQTKLREGNVFTGVCDSVHRGVPGPGGVWS